MAIKRDRVSRYIEVVESYSEVSYEVRMNTGITIRTDAHTSESLEADRRIKLTGRLDMVETTNTTPQRMD